MTVPRAPSARLADWKDALERVGYEVDRMTAENRTLPGSAPRWRLLVHANRLRIYGDAIVSIDIREEWQAEAAAQRGLPSIGRWQLQRATYHAQMDGPDELSAERIDIDPRGGSHPPIHRHPHGQPNNIREPLTGVPPPKQWLQRIEELVIRTSIREDDLKTP